MTIDKNVNELTTENIGQISNFSINVDDPWVYSLLSKNVYNNPIEAIIREIYSNAVDASKTGKIKVEIPTKINGGIFSIEDDGKGMDAEGLKVYTTYGSSTKRDSNEEIGGLGIGCKSPFGYTDQFIVESTCNGKKITLACFLDESGKPSSTITSINDDNGHGTKVTVKIDEDDLSSFYSAAGKVFLFSKYFPIFNEDSKKAFEENISSIENFMKLREKVKGNFIERNEIIRGQIIAEMGGVYYVVPTEIFRNTAFESLTWSSFSRRTIILHANIGDLDFQASRESLRDTEKTKTKLLELMTEAFESSINEYFELANSKNFKEAIKHDVYFDSYYEEQILSKLNKVELKNSYTAANGMISEYFEKFFGYTFAHNSNFHTEKCSYKEFLNRAANSDLKKILILGKNDRVPNSLLEKILRTKDYEDVYYSSNVDVELSVFDEVLAIEDAKKEYQPKPEKGTTVRNRVEDIYKKSFKDSYRDKFSYVNLKEMAERGVKVYVLEEGTNLDYQKRVLVSALNGHAVFTSPRNFKKFDFSIFNNLDDDIKEFFEEHKEDLEFYRVSYDTTNFRNFSKINVENINNDNLKNDIINYRKFHEESSKHQYFSDNIIEMYCSDNSLKRERINLDYKYSELSKNLRLDAEANIIETVANVLYA